MPKLKKIEPIHETVTGYDFRFDKPLNRAPSIRAKCMECQCAQSAEVRRCTIYDCTLWPWRMGHLDTEFGSAESTEDTTDDPARDDGVDSE